MAPDTAIVPRTIVLASRAAEPFCPDVRSLAWVRALRALTARAFLSADSVLMFTLVWVVGCFTTATVYRASKPLPKCSDKH